MSTELVPVDIDLYPLLAGGEDTDLEEVIRENLGDAGLQPRDLDRIPIPAGGGTTWEIETLSGVDSFRELEGIIVAQQTIRKYWSTSIDDSEENTPPDCYSDEGTLGFGLYGEGSTFHSTGDCTTCPMNQWGSGSDTGDGKGPKACREGKMLYLLRPGDIIPSVLVLPPTSLQDYRDYMKALTKARMFFYSAVSKFTLEKAESGGKRWSVVKPGLASVIPPETVAAVKALGISLKASYNGRMAELRATNAAAADVASPVATPAAAPAPQKVKVDKP